jgi:hypothetical protein
MCLKGREMLAVSLAEEEGVAQREGQTGTEGDRHTREGQQGRDL